MQILLYLGKSSLTYSYTNCLNVFDHFVGLALKGQTTLDYYSVLDIITLKVQS